MRMRRKKSTYNRKKHLESGRPYYVNEPVRRVPRAFDRLIPTCVVSRPHVRHIVVSPHAPKKMIVLIVLIVDIIVQNIGILVGYPLRSAALACKLVICVLRRIDKKGMCGVFVVPPGRLSLSFFDSTAI